MTRTPVVAGTRFRLIAGRGGGSTMIEALLTLAELPFDREELDWSTIYAGGATLRAVNPVGHVPALVLPSGEIVTETLAMTLLIEEWAPEARLSPRPGDRQRARYLRLLAMICATIYPMWTVDDRPERFVGEDKDAQKELLKRTQKRRKDLWRIFESLIEADPWALGKRFSALDVFIAVMTRWRPRRAWFARNAPKLAAIAARCDALPGLKEVWARNYG